MVSHGRYVVFQMAEVAIPRQMFQEILRLPELLVAIHTSRQSCCQAGKARIFRQFGRHPGNPETMAHSESSDHKIRHGHTPAGPRIDVGSQEAHRAYSGFSFSMSTT